MSGQLLKHLDGILVADFSRILAGPLCTMLLSDAGARVVKIEEPRGDETRRWGPPYVGDESAYFLSINRNKESIALNLKHPGAHEIAKKIVAKADVVIENFKPEDRAKFGVDAASVHASNPRAVVCSIVGFDSDGPDAAQPGYDLLAQAAGGLMSITGEKDGDPMKVGVALSDVLTAHFAYGAIVTALLARERGAPGQAVEVSLVAATLASLANVAQAHLLTGERPKRYGNEHPSIVPYQQFHGADRPFVIAAASDRQFELLCAGVIVRPELLDDPRYRTNSHRVDNRDSLIEELERVFATKPAKHWVEAAHRAGIPAAIVENVDEALARNPQMRITMEHPTIGRLESVRNPVIWNGSRLDPVSPPPVVGQQSESVLRELGYDAAAIAGLFERGVVA
ncbi:MAG: CoA transferase [Thermoanaerobaculia bacterium]|jgi:crotonobetainyl-CoA:carnitine CoA-transferase CaiB-like acyl-CoA transferase